MESLIEELIRTRNINNGEWDSRNDDDGACYAIYDNQGIYIKINNDRTLLTVYNQNGYLIEHVCYFPNGSIQQRKSYYRNNSQPFFDITFDFEGRITGSYFEYYPDGVLKIKEFYRRNILHGKRITYYPNGKMNTSTCYSFGKKYGVMRSYSDEGIIELELKYQNDLLHGYGYKYDNEGRFIIQEDYYQSGKIINMKKYYNTGIIRVLSQWKNNKLNGNKTKYWEDGSIKSICFYEDGVKDGIWRYFEGDKIIEEISYKGGIKDGDFNMFSLDGNGHLIRSGKYVNNKLVCDDQFDIQTNNRKRKIKV